MANVFINYRRDETSGMAGRLYDRLIGEFSKDVVFMDVDAMKPGIDFVQQLEDQVARCDIVLAVIGPNWSNAKDERGEKRLYQPLDWVRTELAAALQRKIPVVPVLVDGATMPDVSELPDELKPLVRRHAIELRHNRFSNDADAVIEAIIDTTGRGGRSRSKRKAAWMATGFVATSLIAVVAYLVVAGSPIDAMLAPTIEAAKKLVQDQTNAAQDAERRRAAAEVAAREAEVDSMRRREAALDARLAESRKRSDDELQRPRPPPLETAPAASPARTPPPARQAAYAPVEETSSAPSFNCVENTKPAEQTVCGNGRLSKLDTTMAQLYFSLKGRLSASQGVWLRDSQRIWLKQRDGCQWDAQCLDQIYQLRISALQSAGG